MTTSSTLALTWFWVSALRPPLLNALLGCRHYLCALLLTSVPKPQGSAALRVFLLEHMED